MFTCRRRTSLSAAASAARARAARARRRSPTPPAARADAGQGRARVSGRAAGGDHALHAGARSAARLAARQPAGGMRLHAARHLRAARRSAASPAAATPPISRCVLALKPDLILDVGSTSATFVSLAERVQEQTGIPYALLDGRFDAIAGDLSQARRADRPRERGREARALCRRHARRPSPAASRRSRRASGRASITRADRAGSRPGSAARSMSRPSSCSARNVAGEHQGRARHRVDRAGAAVESRRHRHHRPGFRRQRAQRSGLGRRSRRCATGRVHLSPKLPFGWVDFPPSVNRLIGLWWLAKILYPERFPEDLRDADARLLRDASIT